MKIKFNHNIFGDEIKVCTASHGSIEDSPSLWQLSCVFLVFTRAGSPQ